MNRGDVYRVALSAGQGREQRGPRFGVIVQADELELSTVIIAPTSRSARPATFRPQVEIQGNRTRVLVEQIRVADLERLAAHCGRLTPDEQRSVDDALELVLGLR